MSDTPSFSPAHVLAPSSTFADRHIGPNEDEIRTMLDTIGRGSLDDLIRVTVPSSIRTSSALDLPQAKSEEAMIATARALAEENVVMRSFIGMGYHRAVVPPVIQRNILENPAWYTQYTPYQPEISQGRLEALLNFQTMVTDLTGLEIANGSLLDEGTAAAEGVSMALGITRSKRHTLLVASDCHPQTIDVVVTRCAPIGVHVEIADPETFSYDSDDVFAILVQYPSTDGRVRTDLPQIAARAADASAVVIVAADLLSLSLLRPPGEWGADIVVGSTQRFGVPMGFGGPHAAYFATKDAYKRKIPGRLVGVTKDARGEQALRLALQTREQHIKRDRATSNICTSQVLLAVIASMYAAYHGPEGIVRIARRVKFITDAVAHVLSARGVAVDEVERFDTVAFTSSGKEREGILSRARQAHIELRQLDDDRLSATFDEAVTPEEIERLLEVITGSAVGFDAISTHGGDGLFEGDLARTSEFLEHPVFQSYHSEHELLRYMYRLQQKDLSLTTSMIPLGSCTMKLNATAEMIPVTLPGFSSLHPFTDPSNAKGYARLIDECNTMLAEITGLAGVSLQPNAGSQGEYAGLLAIRGYHASRGESGRRVCLIPSSAHGTNPASAVMAGMDVVVIACDERGNIDLEDLRDKAKAHADTLSALMVTYPSTHGVFEEGIVEICQIVHEHGGQVYMDGANMNAQVGICRPGDFGIDVCHLNLHKTMCIPHGGGGPGVGPIAVASHLVPFLPGHEIVDPQRGESGVGPVASAPWGSASILPISWMYMRLMGPKGLTKATKVAILNANYLAARLSDHYEILYTGAQGTVAHEFILDVRPLQESAGVSVADIAKRLMDYGYHAPTMSWPVAGSLMIEPTESESKAELDRFAEAMIAIREEIAQIERGEADREVNLLKMAPHTADIVCQDEWDRPYSRSSAAFPASWTRNSKFWPSVGRVDDAFGDRNLVCACPPLSAYEGEAAE